MKAAAWGGMGEGRAPGSSEEWSSKFFFSSISCAPPRYFKTVERGFPGGRGLEPLKTRKKKMKEERSNIERSNSTVHRTHLIQTLLHHYSRELRIRYTGERKKTITNV